VNPASPSEVNAFKVKLIKQRKEVMLDQWEKHCNLTAQQYFNDGQLIVNTTTNPINNTTNKPITNNTNQNNLNQINNIQGIRPYSQPYINQKQDNYMSQSKGQYPGQYTSQYKGGNTGQGLSLNQPLQQIHPYSQTSFTNPQQNLEANISSQTQWFQGGIQPSMSHKGYFNFQKSA
jgi:hypothetical protein